MKIALVGGIYGMAQEYRERFRITPETTLEQGFRELGHQVDTFSHDAVPQYGQYDVVHVHHLGWGALRPAVDAATTPFVFTVHSFPQVQEPSPRDAEALPRSHRWALRFVMRRIDGLISLSTAEQRYEGSLYKINGALCRVIPNGIPLGDYKRNRIERTKGEPWRLLYVGQLIRNKRIDVLLHAVARLRQPFRLKLAYHSATLEKELMQLGTDLGIRENLEFLGGQTPAQLAALYNEADLFTFPSAYEAFPSVLIESMLCGTPIVSTNVGGISELLGEFGRTVPAGDVARMAAAIEDTLCNYDTWYAQSEPMSRRAVERFSVQTMVQCHLEMYREIISRGGQRRRHSRLLQPGTLAMRALLPRGTNTK